MAYRTTSPPTLQPQESAALEGMCEALAAWLAAATEGGSSPARALHAAYDDRPDRRQQVVAACERGLATAGFDRTPLVALLEAVRELARAPYDPGAGPLDAAAATVESEAEVARRGIHAIAAHEALEETCARTSPAARDALREQKRGFERLLDREPREAASRFGSAARAWRHNGGGEPETPVGCPRCFGNDDVDEAMSNDVLRRSDRLVDDSHFGVTLAECAHCGQPMVTVFVEEVDWKGGDDAQAFHVLALSHSERDVLRRMDEGAVLATLREIGLRRLRLYWEHPTGGKRVAGKRSGGLVL